MENNSIVIERLHQDLLMLSRHEKYGLEMLRCDWGNSGSRQFGEKLAHFCRGIRMLARDCPVKWYNKDYYMFNGMIYERTDEEIVCMAYQMLMEDLCITAAINRSSVRNEVFLRTIRMCNILSPCFDIVAFSNGVVDFGAGIKDPKVLPFSPDYHVTYYHPYEFNPSAKCDRWLNFIHEVLPDRTSRKILQMFLGLGLVQRGNAYDPFNGKQSSKVELCLLMVGTGANGKSVVFDVACNLFGKDKISKMDYGDLTADGDEGMRGRFPIRNAIFNWSSDSDPKSFGRKNTGMFKRIVSGEPIPMRELGRNVLESNSVPYLIFNLNELPFPDDVSMGFIRRLQYVSFDVTIPPERQDPELAVKIIRGELSGVFNWVLRGSLELRKRHFRFPAARGSFRELLLSLMGSNPVAAWVRAYSIRSEPEAKNEVPLWISAKSLYECFERFCRDNDIEDGDIPSPNSWGRQMWSKLRFLKKRAPAGNMYRTFGITEPDLLEHVIISDVSSGEIDEPEPDSFIKDDD